MNKLKFGFAAFVAIGALVVTLATQANTAFEPVPDCYTNITIPADGKTYIKNGTDIPAELPVRQVIPNVAAATVQCEGQDRFCCATLKVVDQVLTLDQVFEQDPE